MTDQGLMLEARAAATTFHCDGPICVNVVLRNASAEPRLVNGRLGVGYEDVANRELYFRILDAEGRLVPVPSAERVRLHRGPLRREDFVVLKAGQSLETEADITIWQKIREPGRYEVVFTYDNVDSGAEFGLDSWTGTVVAGPVSIEVICRPDSS